MLQPDQAAMLLDRLRGKPLYLLASLALATGMRRNELLAIRWCDVDLDAARLTIERALEQTAAHGIPYQGAEDEARAPDDIAAAACRGRATAALGQSAATTSRGRPWEGAG